MMTTLDNGYDVLFVFEFLMVLLVLDTTKEQQFKMNFRRWNYGNHGRA